MPWGGKATGDKARRTARAGARTDVASVGAGLCFADQRCQWRYYRYLRP
jgi:hypothetical protein